MMTALLKPRTEPYEMYGMYIYILYGLFVASLIEMA